MKFHFKIAANSGIGDSLFLLSYLFPIQSYYNNNKDFRVFITYSKTYNNCGHLELIKNFVSRISYAEWVEFENYDKLDLPELTWREKKSDFVEDFIKGHSPTQIEFTLTDDEQNIISDGFFNQPYVFIQLSSNAPQKIWDRENYRKLVNLILKKTNYNIVISDWKSSNWFDIENSRIKSIIGHELALAAELVKRATILVSTDSWNKYIATLANVKRIILCADVSDLGGGFGVWDKIKMLNHVFDPVIIFPKYKLLGITNEKIKNGKFFDADIIKNVNEISSIDVMNEVLKM